jgi:hypothetical protein
VQVASVVCLFVALVLWTAARVSRSGHFRDATACGVFAGILVLTDPIMVLVVFVGIAMIVFLRRSSDLVDVEPARESLHRATTEPSIRPATQVAGRGSERLGSTVLAATACTAFACVIAPWITRNCLVHGEFVFVKSTFGYAFWQGNHPRSFGTDKIPLTSTAIAEASAGGGFRALERSLWHTRLVDTLYIDDAVLASERVAELAKLSEPERSRQLFRESVTYLAQHPAHYGRLCLQRLRYFLLFDETNPKSRVGLYRAAHLTLQILAIIGLWLSRGEWRRLWPTYLAFLLVTTFHSMTIVSARFHLPLEPLQWIWAGFLCGVVGQSVVRCCRAILADRQRSALRYLGQAQT